MEYERKECGPPARGTALLRARAARRLSIGEDPYTKSTYPGVERDWGGGLGYS